MSQEIDIDPNAYTLPFSLTKTIRRDPYPAILPSNPSNSQAGKIIVRKTDPLFLCHITSFLSPRIKSDEAYQNRTPIPFFPTYPHSQIR